MNTGRVYSGAFEWIALYRIGLVNRQFFVILL